MGRDGEPALGDLIEDRWVGSPVGPVIDSNLRETVPPKEEKVIRLGFGIGCDAGKKSARSSMSPASAFARLRPKRYGNSVHRNGRGPGRLPIDRTGWMIEGILSPTMLGQTVFRCNLIENRAYQ